MEREIYCIIEADCPEPVATGGLRGVIASVTRPSTPNHTRINFWVTLRRFS